MSSPSAWHRIPFTSDTSDAVVGFCAAHGGIHDARMLLGLTSDAAGVFVIGDAGGMALVAIVVDRTRNAADAAILETVGVRARLPAAQFIDLVIEPAVVFARAGERRALHVVLNASQTPADGAERALRDAGFAHAYDLFEMRRPESAPALEPPAPLPSGWSWVSLDSARVDDAHAALVEMFREALATNVMPLADFRQAVLSGAARWRVLLDGDRIAGLVRTALDGARGELRILGRVPGYRGRGLGPRLVAEGIRLLREGGAGAFDLSVEAANEQALTLYRRFGFEPISQTPVFALPLR